MDAGGICSYCQRWQWQRWQRHGGHGKGLVRTLHASGPEQLYRHRSREHDFTGPGMSIFQFAQSVHGEYIFLPVCHSCASAHWKGTAVFLNLCCNMLDAGMYGWYVSHPLQIDMHRLKWYRRCLFQLSFARCAH